MIINHQLRIVMLATSLISFAAVVTGCAALHHAQVGQIDNRAGSIGVPFEVLMSESGVSTEEIGTYARAVGNRAGDSVAAIAGIVSLFQMGPRTGILVYNERYAEKLVYLIHEKCPSGRVTGLTSIRETRKYPVVSGEIVKLTGFCLKNRKPASVNSNEEAI